MKTDKKKALALWSAFPPSCFCPTFCPVEQTVGVGVALTDNQSLTLGDPCSHQARPLLEECCWWEFLIFPGPVCPQMWRCGINTSWHHRLATDIRNAAAFLCHVDFGQKSLWLQWPQRPAKNKSMTETRRLLSEAVSRFASHQGTNGFCAKVRLHKRQIERALLTVKITVGLHVVWLILVHLKWFASVSI